MKDKKHIDQIFEEKLRDVKVPAPPAVWERIDQKLGPEKGSPSGRGKWWSLPVISSMMLLSVFMLGGHEPLNPAPIAAKETFAENQNIAQNQPEIAPLPTKPESEELEQTEIMKYQKSVVAPVGKLESGETGDEELAQQVSRPSPQKVIEKEEIAPTRTEQRQFEEEAETSSNKPNDRLFEPMPSIAPLEPKTISSQKKNERDYSVTIVIDIEDSLLQKPKVSAPAQKSSKMKQIFLQLIDMTIEDKK